MTVDKALELLRNQSQIVGGHTQNGAKLILAEIQKEHGQEAIDQLI